MASNILTDIESNLKLLITSITGFEESDEGFQICERFVFSNIKHHRFLSINSHETKRTIDEIEQKFQIYGKYNVAREFRSLVDGFISSFDFENHPQYDLQWSLLSLLINLSKDTTKSEIPSHHTTKIDKTLATNEEVHDIDWGEHLREGQEDFFCNYGSSSESEWSEDEEEKSRVFTEEIRASQQQDTTIPVDESDGLPPKKDTSCFKSAIDSRNWLDSNVENTWWNNLSSNEVKIGSDFPHAQLCRIYNREISDSSKRVGTITEYQACREVLWMFQIPMEMVIYQKKSDCTFVVRDNVSISSLTPFCFQSSFSTFCKYFSMIRRLQLFEQGLLELYNCGKYPPLTLEAYNSSMKQYYHNVKEKIIEIEGKVMKQCQINTYLTLSSDLEDCLMRLKTLDEIHRSVVSTEPEDLNWRKTYRLLTALYKEMENSSNRERANICASLYLSSLRVYLNIIDTWLSEGRLEDFRNEFLISKVKESADEALNEGNSWRMQFVQIENDEICPPDPIMKKLFRKVRDMGRSIELLVTLDRISDMWRINSGKEVSRIPLCDEFIKRILSEVERYGTSSKMEEPDEVDKPEIELESENRKFDELEDNIRQQVLRINNPFLMKVFQKYLPPISSDVVDCKTEGEGEGAVWGLKVFEALEKISPYALPFRKVMGDVLEEILDERYFCAAKLVKDILIKEYKLEMHLKLMRSIFMMERGHIMKKFYQQMFIDIENNLSVTNPESLTHLLEEVLSDEWRDSSSHNRWSISLRDACTRQVLQAIDHVVLNYEIEWPINMVLTADALKKYNEIFRFQLKLKWALWALNNLRFSDLEGKSSVYMRDIVNHFHTRRLESLRFWLLHAIGSIHSYLCGQVLQSLGLVLEEQLARADSLDAIMEAHNDYMEKVHEHCLQTPQFADIMVTINNLLGMCAHVRDRWERGARQLVASELDLMESSFTKYHTYLALALHNAVQYKKADYCKSDSSVLHLRDIFLSNVPYFENYSATTPQFESPPDYSSEC